MLPASHFSVQSDFIHISGVILQRNLSIASE
ncbi:hypothetical protein ECJG_03750 [Escherichia coli M718]|nr:hypothetical protein ECJG_03750 [Escherichia coli M718]OSL66631.1 hypothetical protein EAXG_02435 [Escherichia coli TA054]